MERLKCLVPFCRRTRKQAPPFAEWICGIHWREVPRQSRRVLFRIRRRLRRLLTAERRVFLERLADLAWARCKRQAIERALGIG